MSHNCSSTKLRPGRRLVSLGKLNVPKPLNLPSQKSENAGNDPSVHLVPEKGNVWGGQQRNVNPTASIDRKEQQVGKMRILVKETACYLLAYL